MFWIFRWFWWGSGSRHVATFGGTFRRISNLRRIFRSNLVNRIFRKTFMPSILEMVLSKLVDETVTYIFDFSNFPEVINGETLSNPIVSATGLSVSGTALTTTKLDGVPAGMGVVATISGGTAQTSYTVECVVNCSGGDVRAIKGLIVVE